MENKVITVKGIGKVSAPPDLLVLELKLETVEPEYELAMRRSKEMLNALSDAIVSAGHDGKHLKTNRFNISSKYENYRDKNNNYKSKFIGYACTHDLRLEFDLDMKKLGATLGAIASCEANPTFKIKFSVKDADAVSAELLENAIKNAKWKAEILARSAGVSLGAILRIDYNWGEINVYSKTDLYLAQEPIEEGAAAPMKMDIKPEDIDLNDTVTVVWAIV